MTEKLIALKESKPWLFNLIMVLLALPILGILIVSVFNPILRSWIVLRAKALMDSSKEKDKKLEKDIQDSEKEIAKIDAKIENVNEKLEVIKNENDTDWHKKIKK